MTTAERLKDKRLRDTYNSSLEAFNTLMAEQHNCCAICERPFIVGAGSREFKKEVYTPFQDHFHGCCPRRLKKFCGLCNRGLLCYLCNKFVVGVIEMKSIPADRLAAYMAKWAHIQPRTHAKKCARKKRKK